MEREKNGTLSVPLPFDVIKELYRNPNTSMQEEDDPEVMESFWNLYAHCCKAVGVHFMEHSLEKALQLLKSGNVSDAAICVGPMKRLKPLLLLLGWDVIGSNGMSNAFDVRYHSDLISSLNVDLDSTDDDSDSLVLACCRRLTFQTSLAVWMTKLRSKRKGGSATVDEEEESGVAVDWNLVNETATQALGHTIPFMLKDCLPYENGTSLDTVISFINQDPESTGSMKSADLAIVQAVKALQVVSEFFVQEEGAMDTSSLTGAGASLYSIADPECLIVVCNILFCWGLVNFVNVAPGFTAERMYMLLDLLSACTEVGLNFPPNSFLAHPKTPYPFQKQLKVSKELREIYARFDSLLRESLCRLSFATKLKSYSSSGKVKKSDVNLSTFSSLLKKRFLFVF